jgi:hypothetical protein
LGRIGNASLEILINDKKRWDNAGELEGAGGPPRMKLLVI